MVVDSKASLAADVMRLQAMQGGRCRLQDLQGSGGAMLQNRAVPDGRCIPCRCTKIAPLTPVRYGRVDRRLWYDR